MAQKLFVSRLSFSTATDRLCERFAHIDGRTTRSAPHDAGRGGSGSQRGGRW